MATATAAVVKSTTAVFLLKLTAVVEEERLKRGEVLMVGVG